MNYATGFAQWPNILLNKGIAVPLTAKDENLFAQTVSCPFCGAAKDVPYKGFKMASRNKREGHYAGRNTGVPWEIIRAIKNSYSINRTRSATHFRGLECTTSSRSAWNIYFSRTLR